MCSMRGSVACKGREGSSKGREWHAEGFSGELTERGDVMSSRVGGALEGVPVRAVECGLDLTVALSADGRAWQMGGTGAPPDRRCPWEGARSPAQVPLSSFVAVDHTWSHGLLPRAVLRKGARNLARIL